MKVLDVQILKYYPADDSYYVKYELEVNKHVNRRSKTYYKEGTLLRDNNNKKLKEKIKDLVLTFN